MDRRLSTRPPDAGEIAEALLDGVPRRRRTGGVAELHVVYTQFVDGVAETRVIRLLPLEIVEGVERAAARASPAVRL